jgi:NUDIX domain.
LGFSERSYWKKESEIKAAIREIKEETGIENLEFVDGFRKEINYNFRRKDKLVYKEVVFYLSKTEKRRLNFPSNTKIMFGFHTRRRWKD